MTAFLAYLWLVDLFAIMYWHSLCEGTVLKAGHAGVGHGQGQRRKSICKYITFVPLPIAENKIA